MINNNNKFDDNKNKSVLPACEYIATGIHFAPYTKFYIFEQQLTTNSTFRD